MIIDIRELYILATTEAAKRIIADALDAVDGIDALLDGTEISIMPKMHDEIKLRKAAVGFIDALALFMDSCIPLNKDVDAESKAEMKEQINELRMQYVK